MLSKPISAFPAMLLVLLAVTSARWVSAAGEEHKLASGESYYAWLPAKFDPDVRYLLVVACHGPGTNGTSVGNLARVLHDRNLPAVVVAPNFPWQGPGAHNIDATMTQKSTVLCQDVLGDVKGKWLVHPRLCIFGFSCGSWYAHEFTQRQPGEVLACAGLGYPGTASPKPAAKDIPFLIASGTKDEYFEKTKQWYEKLQLASYTSVTCDWQDGVGHTITPRMLKLTADLFVQAYAAGPGSCVQVGRVTFWPQEATTLEEMNGAAFPLVLQRLRAGAKEQKAPDRAAEAERMLKAVEQWAGKRMATVDELLKTSPVRGMALLKNTSAMLRGDPLAEGFAKREADASRDKELQKELASDRQFEALAETYRKKAERFRKPDDPKLATLRQQFQLALDAFIKANANTSGAARAEKMKSELSGLAANP